MPAMGINRRQLEREEARAREEQRRRQGEARQAEIAETRKIIEAWNTKIAAGRRIFSAPTFGAAKLAGYRWLTVYCPGCGTVVHLGSEPLQLRSAARCGAKTRSGRPCQAPPWPAAQDAGCTVAQRARADPGGHATATT